MLTELFQNIPLTSNRISMLGGFKGLLFLGAKLPKPKNISKGITSNTK